MGFEFDFSKLRKPCLMGIVNVTPNSFSDGGAFLEVWEAVGHANALAGGAQILDIGAEASSFFRPGVEPVDAEEQLKRLTPVLSAVLDKPEAWISVDTRSAIVAKNALQMGAAIINDISAGTHDDAMLETVARLGGAIILMHIGPAYPQNPPTDDPDIINTVRSYLLKRIEAARAAGIPLNRIAVDPGIGFGKTMKDNWRLALGFREEGVPVVLGASRKRFLETKPPEAGDRFMQQWHSMVNALSDPAAHPRDAATAALTALAANDGVSIHRVHHVALAARALALYYRPDHTRER